MLSWLLFAPVSTIASTIVCPYLRVFPMLNSSAYQLGKEDPVQSAAAPPLRGNKGMHGGCQGSRIKVMMHLWWNISKKWSRFKLFFLIWQWFITTPPLFTMPRLCFLCCCCCCCCCCVIPLVILWPCRFYLTTPCWVPTLIHCPSKMLSLIYIILTAIWAVVLEFN